jgi:ABC-type transport system substrate-binding protein
MAKTFLRGMCANLSTSKVVAVVVVVAIIVAAGTYGAFSLSKVTPSAATTTVTASATSPVVSTGGTIVMEQPVGPDTLDPAVCWTGNAEEAVQEVYQGLVIFVPNSTNIEPYLADSYNVSANGLTYNFQLRNNVTFSNGDPLNAYDFWYSIYRSALMAQSSSYLITVALNTTGVTANMLNEFNSTTPPASLLSVMQNSTNAVTVTGQYSLQFHLMAPFAAFLSTLTQPQSYVVDPVVVSAHGGVVAGQTNNWMTANAVGTGPFIITSYEPGIVTVYERNPTYWGGTPGFQSTPRLDKVIAKVVPDALTRLEDLESGSAQVAYVDFSLTPRVVGQPGLYFPKLGPLLGMHWISMDMWKPPLNNILVREAVAHAINVSAILPLWEGFGTGFVGPIPKGVLGYNNNLQPYSYNVTLSKELLAKAGYPNGQGLPTLLFLYTTDRPPSTEVAEVIQSDLENVGFKVTLKGVTTDVSVSILDGDRNPADPNHPDLMYGTWEWFPDPWAFADWFLGPLDVGASNMAWYNNTQVENLLAKADVTSDPTLRAELEQNASAIAYNEYPYVWIAQYQNALLQGVPVTSINVQGYRPTLEALGIDFTTLYIVPTSG